MPRWFAAFSAVHAAEFLTDGYRILTCSDDQSALLWDLASGKRLSSFNEHKVGNTLASGFGHSLIAVTDK